MRRLRGAVRQVQMLRTVAELRSWRAAQRGDVGLVPTMGALHEGHAGLCARAVRENDVALATVFVNPTQFAPTDDLDAYPRDLAGDVATLRRAGVAACFAPAVSDMYGEERGVSVHPPPLLDASAEGAARPGHFVGVCTVVAKLWNLAKPTRSYFGQKDAAQCAVLRRLAADLLVDVDVVVCDTARAGDGLALSSRNAYLSDDERAAAPVIFASLAAARRAWLGGATESASLEAAARAVLDAEPLVSSVEYVSVADYGTTREVAAVAPPDPAAAHPAALVSVAARVGAVRLIDNLPLRVPRFIPGAR